MLGKLCLLIVWAASCTFVKNITLNNQEEIFRLIAKTSAGLEDVLAQEISVLGAQNISMMTRAVAFDADKRLMYRANYELRTALRILKPVVSFTADNEHKLYDEIRKIEWQQWLDIEKTFAIDGVVSGSRFTHSQYVALKVKDAIADQFRDRFGLRPSVNTYDPDLRVNVHIQEDVVSLSFDSSGESLHKRGYRYNVDKAPANEVLAAGLVLLSGWKGETPFVDAMCGSGTIPIEAAMIAMQIPAGYFRKAYGFMKWQDFDAQLWESVKTAANEKMTDLQHEIFASDRSARATGIATQNFRNVHLHKDIRLFTKSMERLTPPPPPGVLIINPPYGERLEESDIKALYTSIGDSLKQNFKGYKAWVISSDLYALKFIGLKPSRKLVVYNGPLECRFVCFDVFEGSLKDKKTRDAGNIDQNEASD